MFSYAIPYVSELKNVTCPTPFRKAEFHETHFSVVNQGLVDLRGTRPSRPLLRFFPFEP
jgi:hypothetical protein